jgi:hypothetical protein
MVTQRLYQHIDVIVKLTPFHTWTAIETLSQICKFKIVYWYKMDWVFIAIVVSSS